MAGGMNAIARFAIRCTATLAVATLASTCGFAQALAAPAMWQVSDADSSVYLFGSIHVLPQDVEWRTPRFNGLLAAAPEVYFETDIGPLGTIALTLKLVTSVAQTLQNSWVPQLTTQQRQDLQKALEPLGMTLDDADRLPPWLVELQIAVATGDPGGDQASKSDLAHGVDSSLQWELPKDRKAYFETPGEQFDILAGEPPDVQIAHLFDTIAASADAPGTSLSELTTAWENGDVEAMTLTADPSDPGDEEQLDRVLYNRNRSWLPKIEQLLRENRADLIVVGAGHLAGARSVLDLLGKDGYTVTRIQ